MKIEMVSVPLSPDVVRTLRAAEHAWALRLNQLDPDTRAIVLEVDRVTSEQMEREALYGHGSVRRGMQYARTAAGDPCDNAGHRA